MKYFSTALSTVLLLAPLHSFHVCAFSLAKTKTSSTIATASSATKARITTHGIFFSVCLYYYYFYNILFMNSLVCKGVSVCQDSLRIYYRFSTISSSIFYYSY
jgi:hypothetical protein